MNLLGCSTNQSISDSSVITDSVYNNQQLLSEIKNKIPKEYLVKCIGYKKFKQNSKPIDIIETHDSNMINAKKCLIIHNKLVDFIEKENL